MLRRALQGSELVKARPLDKEDPLKRKHSMDWSRVFLFYFYFGAFREKLVSDLFENFHLQPKMHVEGGRSLHVSSHS